MKRGLTVLFFCILEELKEDFLSRNKINSILLFKFYSWISHNNNNNSKKFKLNHNFFLLLFQTTGSQKGDFCIDIQMKLRSLFKDTTHTLTFTQIAKWNSFRWSPVQLFATKRRKTTLDGEQTRDYWNKITQWHNRNVFEWMKARSCAPGAGACVCDGMSPKRGEEGERGCIGEWPSPYTVVRF